MGKKTDRTGQVHGLLTVVSENGRSKDGKVLWLCKCRCGAEVTVRGTDLGNKKTRSCGCLKRADLIERKTKHGLVKSNPRLYHSVRLHFQSIRKKVGRRHGYQNWSLDTRYSDDMDGVVKFCRELLALQPDACARYETDRTLDLDKDNDAENVFRPESIVFRPSSENRSKQCDNIKLDDGRPLSEFCRCVGIQTCENGKTTKQYDRICHMYSTSHKPHPELLKKANETIALYKKTLALLKLREDVRRFASAADVQKLLQTSNQESVSLRLVARHTTTSRHRNCKQEAHRPHL